VIDGDAVVYCQGAFGTTTGKTAHGLVRKTRRYRIRSVIDSTKAGKDAGQVLDNVTNGIPVHASLSEALEKLAAAGVRPTHFVIGLAPDAGRLDQAARATVLEAVRAGLNIDSGLHNFVSDDAEIATLAAQTGVKLRDVRKTPSREHLHGFTGKIAEVGALKVALLGTDSAVGKRTTAWKLVDGLVALGHSAELVGTGQTAWLQGARFGIILDSLINDFVAGELEHAVWTAWNEARPEVIVVEGQGSMMNPAYPGGFEILAATRPDVVVMQHAPARLEYDGFPGNPMHPLPTQIHAVELISGKPVVAVTVNHESLDPAEVPQICQKIEQDVQLPVTDVLLDGPEKLARVIATYLKKKSVKCG
jgi:uncharacterized NAD-dependent epimerase/dehydratase family protein